ncbi:MAG: hypothetical protein CM15mP49_25480 [Actinomycetota bacterium]|nr:MAG: hypothetical protein CM15mP49_25480 [Actinomycetota bacterium]
MLRPQKAVEKAREQMMAALEIESLTLSYEHTNQFQNIHKIAISILF